MATHTKTSKFLSLILRHQPDAIGLTLDENGWADVSELLLKINQSGRSLDLETLKTIVAENDKKRFAFSDDGTKIRASQGHSIEVDLGLIPTEPPEILFHGTAKHSIGSIFATGLKPGSRQHVHLSHTLETAIKVGSRHGTPAVLQVQAKKMHEAGHLFYVSANGVWLTDLVPIEFIEQIPEVTG